MTKRIWIVLLMVGVSLCFFPRVSAQASTDSAEIWVGYFGDLYVQINDVSESEMEGLECGEWTYSSIDNGWFTRYNLAYGVTMTSLMNYVGIDTSDINIIYFTGTDEYSGEKGNHGLYNLFGVRHYYFPYLAEYWDQEKGVATEPAIVEGTYYEVPAILAFQQSLARDSGAFDYDKYKARMSDDKCLRIVFGQTEYNEVSTADSVYWVYRITVCLKGSPIKTSNWEAKIGSSQAMEDYVQVDSGYAELDELLKSRIQVSSDNPGVVQVDANGNLIAVGAGTARIQIEVDGGNEGSFSEQIVATITGDSTYDPGSTGGYTEETTPGERDGGSSESTPGEPTDQGQAESTPGNPDKGFSEEDTPDSGGGLGSETTPGSGSGSSGDAESKPGSGSGSSGDAESKPGSGSGSSGDAESTPGSGSGSSSGDAESTPGSGSGSSLGDAESTPGEGSGSGTSVDAESTPGEGSGSGSREDEESTPSGEGGSGGGILMPEDDPTQHLPSADPGDPDEGGSTDTGGSPSAGGSTDTGGSPSAGGSPSEGDSSDNSDEAGSPDGGSSSAETGGSTASGSSSGGGSTTGDNSGAADSAEDSAQEAARVEDAIAAGEENVPLSEEAENVYDEVKEYMQEQIEDMENVPSSERITNLTGEVREYIEELIEQAEEEDRPVDLEEIIEMVEEYIDERVEEIEEEEEEAAAAATQLSTEDTSEAAESRENDSGEEKSSTGVYLSVGNINGGDSGGGRSGGVTSSNDNVSTGNTSGGTGGKVLEVEPLPLYYTVLITVAVVAMFVGGGLYRSLRFRRETAER